jgi:pimeloyl-ACP methyl ester carboxylesterase
MIKPLSAALTLTIAASYVSWESRAGICQPSKNEATPPALDALVNQYFRADDAKERTILASSIEKAAGSSIEAVATAVRRVMVWEPMPDGDIAIQSSTSGTITAKYHGSLDLDPAPRHGLVLCMPNDDEADTNLTLNRAITVLGPNFCDSCGLAALSRSIGGSFHQHPAAADDLRRIIRELRRRIHLDTDRLYLFGFREGGEAAWMASLFQPDLFAGVIVVAAHPKLPFPQQVYPLLLPNLKDVPLAVIDPATDGPNAAPPSVLDAHLDAIVQLAGQTSLPIRRVTVPFDDGEDGMLPRWDTTKDELAGIRSKSRTKPGRTVSHWFRYPAQGDVGWLRAVKTYGDVWTEDQLSIAVGPTTDRDAFITDVIKEKLFHLGGRVEGQTIHIETKHIAEVELRLFDWMVDFAKPITVIINGRKRHEGLVKPNIATLLESAYEEWEFQRLVFAELPFSIRAD